jgi:hypothetical protein
MTNDFNMEEKGMEDLQELTKLYDKYEALYYKLYDKMLDKFFEESYLKSKVCKNPEGDICVLTEGGKEIPLRKIDFEEVKERIFEIWENKLENSKVTLDDEDIMEEIINSVTLYFVAREARKTMVHN